MILPSNDAWVGNGDPMAYPVIDESGAFMPVTINVAGSYVLDGGTEVNDEIAENTVSPTPLSVVVCAMLSCRSLLHSIRR